MFAFVRLGRGISCHLLKVGSKRRKTRAELDALREEEEVKEEAVKNQEQQIVALSDQVAELKRQAVNESGAA